MFSYKYSHFNTNTTPTKFFTRNQQESQTQSDHWTQNPNTNYANFSLSLLREFLIESTQCCRYDSIHYFQEDMGNGLVSPICRHHLTSIYFFEFLFFFQKQKRFESFNTKRIMQLHLRCHSRKSRHKFVVQLRRMLLVRVFFNGHKNVPHANDMDDQTSERSYENGSITFYQMNL